MALLLLVEHASCTKLPHRESTAVYVHIRREWYLVTAMAPSGFHRLRSWRCRPLPGYVVRWSADFPASRYATSHRVPVTSGSKLSRKGEQPLVCALPTPQSMVGSFATPHGNAPLNVVRPSVDSTYVHASLHGTPAFDGSASVPDASAAAGLPEGEFPAALAAPAARRAPCIHRTA